MALTSSTTLSDALAQYNNNLSWEGSPTKAAAALEALRWLFVNRPVSNTTGDGRTINYAALEPEKARLETYVNSQSAAVKAGRSSFVRGVMRT